MSATPIARRDGGEDFVKQVNEMGGAERGHGEIPSGRQARPRVQRDRLWQACARRRPRADGKIGVPIAGDDKGAIDLASALIREVGFEPVLVGDLAMGKYLVPGTPLAGEHTPDEIKQIAATLKS